MRRKKRGFTFIELLTVMVVTIVVYAFVGRPSLVGLIVSRIVLIPVIAGLAYEVIRFSARHLSNPVCRLLTRPGMLLQKITTKEPDDRQRGPRLPDLVGPSAAVRHPAESHGRT